MVGFHRQSEAPGQAKMSSVIVMAHIINQPVFA
jgi:hypothetical protein